jgi:ATP-binding protein involved in chromosome partitioning
MLGIDQRPISLDGMIIPPVAHDLRVMSIGFFLEQEGAVIWRGPMLHRALEQFLSDVHWGELDYLVVDMPPGTGDVGLSLGQLMPQAEAIVVTTPQLAAQRVAERAAAMVTKLGQTLVGVVENMSGYPCPCCGELTTPFGHGGGARLAAGLGVPLLGEVPLEAALREGSDAGVPLMLTAPDSPAALAISGIAERLDALRPRGPVKVASPFTLIRG